MFKSEKKTEKIEIRVKPTTKQDLKKLADKSNCSVADIINFAIEKLLNSNN